MRRCTVLLLVIFLFVSPVYCAAQTSEPQETELYAGAAVLLDGTSGRILYGKNENERLPMASTTKVMTCILALEKGESSMECEVSAQAASAPKVKLGAAQGRRFRLEDLLYSLMLESHNDTAIVIAEAVGGSVEGFALMMNEKAEEIGLEDTAFVTPNGLDADGHYTTAADLARLLRYCITDSPKRKEFLTVTGRQSYSFSDTEQKKTYTVTNHNAFLTMMDGALTGKTGFTGKAGYCYVGALEKDGRLFIVALLACGWPSNRSYKWSDTKRLMRYGLDAYQNRKLSADRPLPETLPVRDGAYGWSEGETQATVALTCEAPESICCLAKEDEKVQTEVFLETELEAPVREGQTVGVLRYLVGGQCLGEYPVRTAAAVEKRDWRWYLQQAAASFFE